MKTPFGTHATEMLGLICRGGRDPLTAQEPSGCTDRGVACLTHFWSERRPTRLGTSNKCPRDPQSTFPEQEQLRDQNQSNPLFSGFFGMIPLLGCRFLSSHTHTHLPKNKILVVVWGACKVDEPCCLSLGLPCVLKNLFSGASTTRVTRPSSM